MISLATILLCFAVGIIILEAFFEFDYETARFAVKAISIIGTILLIAELYTWTIERFT